MSNALAGTAYISIDGRSYRLVGELEWDSGLVVRESQAGMDGVHGFSVKPRVPFISGKFRDSGDLAVADFNAMEDVTIAVELVNGKTILGRNMWHVGEMTVNSEDGTVALKWEGPQGAVTEN